MAEQDKFWRLRVTKDLEILLPFDAKSRLSIRLHVAKAATLDPEELDWLTASLFFVKRLRKQTRYNYKWTLSTPQIMHVSNETRHMLGVIERSFKGGRDLDLTLQS